MLSLKPMPAARKKNWDMSCLLLGGAHLETKYSNGTEIEILSHSFPTLELRLMALFYSSLYNVPYISNEGQFWTADRSI